MIQYDMTRYDTIWHDMTQYDKIWIWYDRLTSVSTFLMQYQRIDTTHTPKMYLDYTTKTMSTWQELIAVSPEKNTMIELRNNVTTQTDFPSINVVSDRSALYRGTNAK